MALFLFRFYPVLLPLLLYLSWLYIVRKRAVRKGETPPRFRDGPVFWLLMSSLVIAVLCFVFLGFSTQGTKGVYQPPHMEGGKLVPSQVKPVGEGL